MHKIPAPARTRLKENIKIARKVGKHQVAKDLALHIYFADTLQYYHLQDLTKKHK